MTDHDFSEIPPKTGDTLPGVAKGIDDVMRLLFELRGSLFQLEKKLEDMRVANMVWKAGIELVVDDHEQRISALEAAAR